MSTTDNKFPFPEGPLATQPPEYVRRRTEWGVLREFTNVGKPGHVIEPAAANDADFCLRQDFLLPMKVVGEA